MPVSLAGHERLRLFAALPLPDAVRLRLVGWQRRCFAETGGVRLVRPDNLHVTLAFLGSTPATELPRVVDAVRSAAAGAPPPLLRVAGYRETRSVAMLVLDDEDGRAGGLAREAQARLERLGLYRPEQRPWLAHVTVLRFGRPPRLSPPLPDLGPIVPSEAAVYHSLLRRSGAQYQVVEAVSLGG